MDVDMTWGWSEVSSRLWMIWEERRMLYGDRERGNSCERHPLPKSRCSDACLRLI